MTGALKIVAGLSAVAARPRVAEGSEQAAVPCAARDPAETSAAATQTARTAVSRVVGAVGDMASLLQRLDSFEDVVEERWSDFRGAGTPARVRKRVGTAPAGT